MQFTSATQVNANPPQESLAAQNAAGNAELNGHPALASPEPGAAQPAESGPAPVPAPVADPASLDEKRASAPIPADSASFEQATTRAAASISGRDSKPAREQAAKPGSPKIAVDANREGPSVAGNETNSLAANFSRDPAAIVGAVEKHASAPAEAGSVVSDPFNALDAARTPPHAWIHAGAHHAEAGYLDPALGWIGVRADATAGGVHAALVPGSSEAAQVLGSNLAGLNAYLSEHHREPATVTMAAPQDGQDGSGMGQGTHAGEGGSPHRHSAQGGEAFNEGESPSVPRIVGGMPRAPAETSQTLAPGGKHISLMA